MTFVLFGIEFCFPPFYMDACFGFWLLSIRPTENLPRSLFSVRISKLEGIYVDFLFMHVIEEWFI